MKHLFNITKSQLARLPNLGAAGSGTIRTEDDHGWRVFSSIVEGRDVITVCIFNHNTNGWQNLHSYHPKEDTKETKMTVPNVKVDVVDMAKADLVDGAYRAAARNITRVAKNSVANLANKKGWDTDKTKLLAETLNTPVGEAGVSAALGYVFTFAPMLKDDARAKRLAKEFRVEGNAVLIDEVMKTVLEAFLPNLAEIMSALPSPEEK